MTAFLPPSSICLAAGSTICSFLDVPMQASSRRLTRHFGVVCDRPHFASADARTNSPLASVMKCPPVPEPPRVGKPAAAREIMIFLDRKKVTPSQVMFFGTLLWRGEVSQLAPKRRTHTHSREPCRGATAGIHPIQVITGRRRSSA